MKHALVVGGTGMLKTTSLWLTQNGYHVSIIARSQERMERLIMEANDPSLITPLYVDYTDTFTLEEKLRVCIEINGPISLVVAWIHSIGKKALFTIIEEVTKCDLHWDLYHILGSSANFSEMKERANVPSQCTYHQIQLGFVINNGNQSRWLTDSEISNGVIQAMEDKKLIHTVGRLEPWEKRP
ncbi:short-chain dehydrogenase [Oceanobacillus piezotolerans]|uniref:Short-chain dehydrogenase n=1 Tax=Oceanobacillus piezotolerans TaxID=2448030 RepID=A0A498DGE8_9BACI|nr:short-chain dehydrogenase [Oceanobacillus piezotolerans]RLL48268.1 short-chain dehydrogenase [Oceanobacillus piezotolerans]